MSAEKAHEIAISPELLKAALDRARSSVEAESELAPGLHEVDTIVHLSGMVEVCEPTRATNNTFTDSELLAVIIANLPEAERRQAIADAIAAIREHRATAAGKRDLKHRRDLTANAVREAANEARMRKTATRKGALKGGVNVEVMAS